MRLAEWMRKVTTSGKALEWIDSEEGEQRIVRAYKELLQGYNEDPGTVLKETRPVVGAHHGLVSISGISFYSLCGHHFLPFFGKVTITYEPGASIIGLGKFPRLVKILSQRFQIQEDLVKEIAEEVMRSGKAKGVQVTSTARHLCMCSRGPQDDTVETTTTYALGSLQEQQR